MNVSDGSGKDVDLNLAPIIDCFTVLITYLLVTASFLTLAAVDVGVSATGTNTTTASSGPPPLTMMLQLKATGDVTIEIQGGTLQKEINVDVAPIAGNKRNMVQLTQRLKQVQTQWPKLKEVSVSADSTVVYKDIVDVIHKVQKIMPTVYISS